MSDYLFSQDVLLLYKFWKWGSIASVHHLPIVVVDLLVIAHKSLVVGFFHPA